VVLRWRHPLVAQQRHVPASYDAEIVKVLAMLASDYLVDAHSRCSGCAAQLGDRVRHRSELVRHHSLSLRSQLLRVLELLRALELLRVLELFLLVQSGALHAFLQSRAVLLLLAESLALKLLLQLRTLRLLLLDYSCALRLLQSRALRLS
jgi:hypothetical protein